MGCLPSGVPGCTGELMPRGRPRKVIDPAVKVVQIGCVLVFKGVVVGPFVSEEAAKRWRKDHQTQLLGQHTKLSPLMQPVDGEVK